MKGEAESKFGSFLVFSLCVLFFSHDPSTPCTTVPSSATPGDVTAASEVDVEEAFRDEEVPAAAAAAAAEEKAAAAPAGVVGARMAALPAANPRITEPREEADAAAAAPGAAAAAAAGDDNEGVLEAKGDFFDDDAEPDDGVCTA